MKTKKGKGPKKQLSNYLRYSGMAMQMGLTIYLGSLLGKYIDQKAVNTEELYYKIITLLSVFISMYMIIKQVTNESKKD